MPNMTSNEWFSVVSGGFDLGLAGIYEWRISGIGIYVGKAALLTKRIRAYPNNVRRMGQNLPWHGNPNKSYRLIHHALLQARAERLPVEVHVLENCALDDRSAREHYWIQRRANEAAHGGPALLNSGYWDNSRSLIIH
jgi:hypothetical protein